jgi:septal ring factor EnvC (AmiA/AmiB activator)
VTERARTSSTAPSSIAPRLSRGLAHVVVLTAIACSAGANANTSAQKARLEALLADVEARRADLRTLEGEERSLFVTIGDLDRALFELDRAFDDARVRKEELDEEAARIDIELARDVEREREVALRLEKRLRALYVLGDAGAIRHLLGAETFEDLAYRRRLLTSLAENDALLAREHTRIVTSVREKREQLTAARDEMAMLASKLEEERVASAAARLDRALMMKRIDGEKELLARTLRELLTEERAVRQELTRLTKTSMSSSTKAGTGTLLKRGGLLRPVEGSVLRAFGTVREAGTGASLTSNGVHLKAALGTPVQAPADGRVAHTGWLRGYGRMIIVDHGGGVHTLYAHLQRETVEKGEMVTRGQTIGFVGDTESFDGAELYFELRKNGRPRDPTPYF